MKIVHVLAGLGYASGVANIARRFARAQREQGDKVMMLAPAFKWNPIYFGLLFAIKAAWYVRKADEVWVHCSWTFPVWYGAWLARRFRKRLIVVPEGSFDPKRLHNHAEWKKRLVAPLDRWVLRVANEVLVLCSDEAEWIRAFEPSCNSHFSQVPIFLPPTAASHSSLPTTHSPLHVLFLGRASDPLKGVKYLELAVSELNYWARTYLPKCPKEGVVELRIVSNHKGEELERDWDWCDVLCLPTLSDNFGLVVAEALERGKRVITTDGAPAWANFENTNLIYLKGFRDGTDAQRVALLKVALKHYVD